MKGFFLVLFATLSFFQLMSQQPYALMLHGGAGNFDSNNFTAEEKADYRNIFEQVLIVGDSLLRNGIAAIDVAVICVAMLEDCPLFNAGKGAVFTAEGRHELDASVMNGKDLKAGAVAGVSTIKNPVLAARRVMDSTEHVMLIGPGAEKFAALQGLTLVDNTYFSTPEMHQRYLNASKSGTVGAVVLDRHGNLAAATSTGGMMMKKHGRVGDSPIIGAGTYADNKTCAVSCTGHGEYFIRYMAAFNIVAMMRYQQLSLEEACRRSIREMADAGGTGGVIAIDTNANVFAYFSTKSMFRAYTRNSAEFVIEF